MDAGQGSSFQPDPVFKLFFLFDKDRFEHGFQPHNFINDSVFVTDVTADLVTVTIKESATLEGFFKSL
jgi:hypothetical protein